MDIQKERIKQNIKRANVILNDPLFKERQLS